MVIKISSNKKKPRYSKNIYYHPHKKSNKTKYGTQHKNKIKIIKKIQKKQ